MKLKTLFAIGAMAASLTFVRGAGASLGGDLNSVHEDQMKMQGTLRSTSNDSYNVQEIQGANGTVLREYVSSAGTVFGVTWQGRTHPDLDQVLGAYYNSYVQAVKTKRTQRRGHGPLVIEEPGFVLHTGGHMRSLIGKAYLPQNLPAGVGSEEIR
jgi:hypothetical protein